MKKIIFLIILFQYFSTYLFAQNPTLLITEIFADPTPSKGLPEKEFLEIQNISNEDVNIKGFIISNNGAESILGEYLLPAREFLIVCKKDAEKEFLLFGKVLVINNLSLLNAGGNLILKNPKKEIIQMINYGVDWYTPKSSEGYSLEIIDNQKSCLGKENWASSTDGKGATPGKINAVSKTLILNAGPVLSSSEIDKNVITLSFSQNLDSESLQNLDKIVFENKDIKIIKNLSLPLFSSVLKFELNTLIINKEKIAFNVKSPTNCLLQVGKDIEVFFYNLPKSKKGDLFISEILYNPKSDQSEFFEIYNASEKDLNLKEFAVNAKANELSSLRILSKNDLIIKSKTYIVFAKEKENFQIIYPNLKDKFYEMSSFPSLSNTGGVLNLISPDSILYDSFIFNDNLHSKFITNSAGVSLERISFKVSGTTPSNVHSASQSVGFMTPAQANSSIETSKTENIFTLNRKTVIVNDPSKSKVTLSYAMNSLDYQATVNIFNKEGKLCKKIAGNKSLGINGQFEWDGTDNSGQILPIGYYFFHIEYRNASSSSSQNVPVIVGAF